MIRVENLHKYFGDLKVLKGINEHIQEGEVVAVIGPVSYTHLTLPTTSRV